MWGAPHGRQRSTGESPKKHAIGFPRPAARCIAPPSLQTMASHSARPAIKDPRSEVGHGRGGRLFPTSVMMVAAFPSSPGCWGWSSAPGDQNNRVEASCTWPIVLMKWAKRWAGQRWASRRALMCTPIKGRFRPDEPIRLRTRLVAAALGETRRAGAAPEYPSTRAEVSVRSTSCCPGVGALERTILAGESSLASLSPRMS